MCYCYHVIVISQFEIVYNFVNYYNRVIEVDDFHITVRNVNHDHTNMVSSGPCLMVLTLLLLLG